MKLKIYYLALSLSFLGLIFYIYSYIKTGELTGVLFTTAASSLSLIASVLETIKKSRGERENKSILSFDRSITNSISGSGNIINNTVNHKIGLGDKEESLE